MTDYVVEVFTAGSAAVKQVFNEEQAQAVINLFTDHANGVRKEDDPKVFTFKVNGDDGTEKRVHIAMDYIVAFTSTPVPEPDEAKTETGDDS